MITALPMGRVVIECTAMVTFTGVPLVTLEGSIDMVVVVPGQLRKNKAFILATDAASNILQERFQHKNTLYLPVGVYVQLRPYLENLIYISHFFF